MKKLFVAIFLLVIPIISVADVNFKVVNSPVANLIYQLNCVSRHSPNCSYHNYVALWNDNFLKSEEDRTLLSKWKELMDRYNNKELFEKINLSEKLNIVSFQSQNLEDYFEKLDIITINEDKEVIKNIIEYFYPKFIKWWHKEAKSTGDLFKRKIIHILKRTVIANKIKQFAKFYETTLPDSFSFTINLIYKPAIVDEPQYGEQIKHYSTMEFIAGKDPIDSIHIPLHELCHLFFSHSNKDKFTKLQSDFIRLNSLETATAYNLLDETVATAFNQGIIMRINKSQEEWNKYLDKTQSFYNNYYIDKAAKAILPMLDSWLANKKTIYATDFIDQYVKILKDTFNVELLAPKIQLMNMILYTNQKQFNTEFRHYIINLFDTRLLYEEDFKLNSLYDAKNENLNSLFVICLDQNQNGNFNENKNFDFLPQKQQRIVEREYKRNSKVIFSYRKNASTRSFLIVAGDLNTVYTLLNKLASLKTGFDGVLPL